MDTLSLACRILLVLVFAVSSTSKLRSGPFDELRTSVRTARLLPARVVSPVLGAMVAAEATAAVLLVVPTTVRLGAGLAALLLAAFVVVIVTSARRRTGLTCRCFGGNGAALGGRHVARNAMLLVACAVVVAGPGALPQHAESVALALVAATVLAVLVIRLDDLAALALPRART
ncbi:MauE/DoxX family redox-associated membrane protein [Cellulomonas persica]|uniref:Methylamine utilisation protein MauE domain-containing protein n=1 Tax=Cellulomonas persica TaxID=76861 RepID=A0A510UX33_9CELL|nr:MauE/DoxX family redox-associated membrane protein [Cellulomonas persica]GEK19247.1 hypothetical protein CPE01_29800 [Cellulomonas persica]